MSVNTQVSGNKQVNIQPSKNLGTVIDTEVSGNRINATLKYKKLTAVQPTQVSGEVHNTNYMGVNDEGMNIRNAKKITGNELNVETYPTKQDAQAGYIYTANALIAQQEADKKSKAFSDLVGVEITTAPTKVTYIEGQDFDPTGMVVKAIYDDGTIKEVEDYTVTGGTNLQTTTTKVTISYTQGSVVVSTSQAITVNAKSLVSIAVTTAPTKVEYTEGELFDPTGMVITGTYDNDSTGTITDYTYAPNTALATTDEVITITASGKTTTQAITVSAAPEPTPDSTPGAE